MSLLMDALRRAEQEKKQQQKSGATEAESTLTADDAMDVTAMAAQTVESPFAGPEDVTMQIEPANLSGRAKPPSTMLLRLPVPSIPKSKTMAMTVAHSPLMTMLVRP